MKASYLLYQQIIKERGLSTYAVAALSRVPQCAFSKWKLHDVVPKFQRMTNIAAALSTPESEVRAVDFYEADMLDASPDEAAAIAWRAIVRRGAAK